MEMGLAYSAAGFGLYYAALATWLWRTAPETLRQLSEAFIALALGFGTMAIPFAFDDSFTTGIAWALEGAGVFWVGSRQDRLLARAAGTALQGLAAIAFAVSLASHSSSSWADVNLMLANGRFLSCAALSFAGFLIAREVFVLGDSARAYERPIGTLFGWWGLAWGLAGFFSDIESFIPSSYEGPAVVAVVALVGLALERCAAGTGWGPGRSMALFPIPLAIWLLPAAVDSQHHLLSHGGWLAWSLYLSSVYVVLRRLEDDRPSWLPQAYASALWIATALGAISLTTWVEGELHLAGDWPAAAFGFVLAAAILTAIYSAERGFGAFADHARVLMTWGLCPVIVTALFWAMGVNLSAEGNADPLAYVPLINPTDLSLGIAAVAILTWWMRLHRESPDWLTGDRHTLIVATLAWVAFLWLNGFLARTVHQWTGVAFHPNGLWDSVPLQVSVSISWTLVSLALMLWSSRSSLPYRAGARATWIAAACLLGVVVVKLFVIDLSQLSTVARIGTFLVVGVLLLIVGYLSPVPPSAPDSEDDRPLGSPTTPSEPTTIIWPGEEVS
jgi:uncharacterized membrane protein